MSTVQITILNAMADRDFEVSLNKHVEWGLQLLDLKDSIFGKNVSNLTNEEAERAAGMIRDRGMSVYCLSTALFNDDIEIGEAAFRQKHLKPISRVVEIAQILQPRFVRLIAAKTAMRREIADSAAYAHAHYPWLFDLYSEAISLIHAGGSMATIENETGGCLLSNPDEITSFFDAIGAGEKACFTWDVVNLWRVGTFPTLEVYESLKPLIGYYHVKGGRSSEGGQDLRWKSSLEQASWPVSEITRRIIADRASPVICINSPKGSHLPGDNAESRIEADLAYVRRLINKEQQT